VHLRSFRYKITRVDVVDPSLHGGKATLLADLAADEDKCKSFLIESKYIKKEWTLLQSPTFHGITLETALPWIVNYVGSTFPDKYRSVRGHTKYPAAAAWIASRTPELAAKSSSAAVVAFLCCVAVDAWDVREIIAALVRPTLSTDCMGKDVSELLYCIATTFLFLSRRLQAPLRLHFLVYQALYYFENDWTYDASETKMALGVEPSIKRKTEMAAFGEPSKKKKSTSGGGQLSLLNFAGFTTTKKSVDLSPTAEQMAVIRHPIDLTSPSVTKIVAFAGTGKTTTLVRLCQQNPGLRFLCVMYNKAAKMHAENRHRMNR
jgi:F-box protein 18 (helicase)